MTLVKVLLSVGAMGLGVLVASLGAAIIDSCPGYRSLSSGENALRYGCGGGCYDSSDCNSGCYCQRYDDRSTQGACAGTSDPRRAQPGATGQDAGQWWD